MSVNWNCDVCGKATQMNPPYEFETNDEGTPIQITTRQQNIFTGDIDDIPAYKLIYKNDKTYIVRLDLGGESIQKDFCEKCFLKIKPDLELAYQLLRNIRSK